MLTTSRRTFLTTVGLGVLAALAAACQLPAAAVTEARSSRPRQAASAATPDEVQAHVAAVTAFAGDLYRQFPREGNLIYSPYSIGQALMMVLAGAAGQTADQMTRSLHLALPPERVHAAAGALELELLNRAADAGGSEGADSLLYITNAMWGQQGHRFLPAFLDRLAEHYGAGVNLLDFRGDPERARTAINAAINEQTKGEIRDLLPPASVPADTRLVLTNAIYFKAPWQTPFQTELTQERPFRLESGEQVPVPMMQGGAGIGFAAGDGYQVVEVPYRGDRSMLLLVPDAGRRADVERTLAAGQASELLAAVAPRTVNLSLPKFDFQASTMALKDALTQLGMTDLFQPGVADLSAMDGTHDLFVRNGYHQATVTVDEAGTKAAAATGMVVGIVSAPAEPPVTVVVDRPFLFVIRDRPTGAILFLGRVVDPRAGSGA